MARTTAAGRPSKTVVTTSFMVVLAFCWEPPEAWPSTKVTRSRPCSEASLGETRRPQRSGTSRVAFLSSSALGARSGSPWCWATAVTWVTEASTGRVRSATLRELWDHR